MKTEECHDPMHKRHKMTPWKWEQADGTMAIQKITKIIPVNPKASTNIEIIKKCDAKIITVAGMLIILY